MTYTQALAVYFWSDLQRMVGHRHIERAALVDGNS